MRSCRIWYTEVSTVSIPSSPHPSPHQAGLEQQAKAHLEEELRAEMEEKDHMIVTLNTKVGSNNSLTGATAESKKVLPESQPCQPKPSCLYRWPC